MAHLSKLKFSDKQRSQINMTAEERLRHKLIDRLKEQKELAEADLSGNALVKTRYKMIKDEETGETKRVQVPRLLRRRLQHLVQLAGRDCTWSTIRTSLLSGRQRRFWSTVRRRASRFSTRTECVTAGPSPTPPS